MVVILFKVDAIRFCKIICSTEVGNEEDAVVPSALYIPQYITPSPTKVTDISAVVREAETVRNLIGGADFSVLAIEGMNVGTIVIVTVGARVAPAANVGAMVGTKVGITVGT